VPTVVTIEMQSLYQRHYLALVRLAVHLVDDLETAEDVVQDVFAALRTLPDDPARYLQRAVVNRARSVLRRRKVVRGFLARGTRFDHVEPADGDVLRAEHRRTVLAAVDRLPQRQREIVVLRFYEGLGVGEIADVLGISPGAVSSSLSRALDSLQHRIGVNREH
jgi:RNA polymerase sigma factor (sigma-70 family)